MNNSYQNQRQGNAGNFQKNNSGNSKKSRPMYNAVCDNCGKNCQLPFKPSTDKPVYCNDCFARKKGRDRGNNYSRNWQQKTDSAGGQITRQEASGMSDQRAVQIIEKLASLNNKLDMVIKLLSPEAKKKPVFSEKKEQKEETVSVRQLAVTGETKSDSAKSFRDANPASAGSDPDITRPGKEKITEVKKEMVLMDSSIKDEKKSASVSIEKKEKQDEVKEEKKKSVRKKKTAKKTAEGKNPETKSGAGSS